jgi:hypothetical protein
LVPFAALEESWLDISEVSSGVSSYGLLALALAPFTGGVSLAVAAAAAALPPHRVVTFNLRQRTELREKLSNTRSALEKARAELKTAKEELECLQAARDLEADLPSLQHEVDRELEFAFQKISI